MEANQIPDLTQIQALVSFFNEYLNKMGLRVIIASNTERSKLMAREMSAYQSERWDKVKDYTMLDDSIDAKYELFLRIKRKDDLLKAETKHTL